ncbi:zinc finger protein 1 [Hydra vulgaris]|uniref:Zinc finger protein 1 n=1 Tax=Hydra vulgaris TaxID=6087 RepID=A0ABM4B6Y1_HYDVU
MNNTHSLKIDENGITFKQNNQLLASNKNSNTSPTIFSVQSSHRQQQRYSSMYENSNSDILTTNRLHLNDSSNDQNLSYLSSHNSNGSNLSSAFNNRQIQAPQIYNASLNSSNLLSSTGGEHTHMLTNQVKHETSQENQNYSQHIRIGIVSSDSSTGSTSNIQSNSMSYSQSTMGLQYSTSGSFQTSNNTLVTLESQQGGHQPTYVILQAPDGEGGGQSQMFIAMHAPGLSNQDPQQQHQPYVTLQPVDENDLANAGLVQEGMSLQQVVMASSSNINVDSKSENGQQVVLSIPSQQSILQQTGNGQPMVAYLQSLDHGQVIMAASDLSGNLTLHNVTGLSNKRNILSAARSAASAVGLAPRRRLSTDPRSCEQCGRCFKYPSDLKKHLQIHTDVKKFECDECPRTFRRLHQLNVHKRIHTGEKPYVCNRCGAQFRHDSTLTMHIRTRHDHLKPFTCDGCGKKFGRMSHLRKHQRNVCGRNEVRGTTVYCKYCAMQFAKKSDLKTHFMLCEKKPDPIEKEILSPTPFICDCGKEFNRVYDFKRHQLSHSDEKPYGCPQCGKMFKERSSLNKHVKRMHCSEGDGTIPIDDDGVIAGDDDDDEEEDDEMSGEEHELTSTDIIVSLSMTGNDGTQSKTATVAAQTLAQAGIITSSDGRVMTASGHPLTAAEILNFPEVAEALGINSSIHATVLETDDNSTMIAITQANELETSEVSMEMEQNMIQDNLICSTSGHYMSSSDSLSMNRVTTGPENSDLPTMYSSDNTDMYNGDNSVDYSSSLDNNMTFKQEDTERYLKVENDFNTVDDEQNSNYNPQILSEDSTDDNLVLNSV